MDLLDREKICRVCFEESKELLDIFEPSNAVEGLTISEVLNEFTQYRVERFDKMPQQMCATCIKDANNAFRFKKRTEEAYRKLMGLLEDSKMLPNLQKASPATTTVIARSEQSTQTEKLCLHPCEFCSEKFFDSTDLREHRTMMHRGNGIICRVCNKKFNRMRELRSHLLQEHPSDAATIEHQCTVCKRTFSRKDHLKRHLLKIHQIEHSQLSTKDMKVTLEEPEIELQINKADVSNNTQWVSSEMSAVENIEIIPTLPNPIQIDEDDTKEKFDAMKSLQSLKAEPEKMQIKIEETDPCTYETSPNWSVNTLTTSELNLKKEQPSEEISNNSKTLEDDDDSNGSDFNETNRFKYDSDNDDDSDSEDDKPLVVQKNKSQERPNAGRKRVVTSEEGDDSKANRCTKCERTFARLCHLKRHMLSHLEEKPHGCVHCDKRFTRSDHLKKHIMNVHNVKEFKCDQCSSAFVRFAELTRHKNVRHGSDPAAHKIHDCDFCGKKFTSKTYLQKHRLMHTDRIFACKYCEETFKDRKQFREHEKTHNRGRNFLCSICGESFVRNDYLRVHMRRHNGEKPYKCRFCGKGFPRGTDVKIHERYHMGIKPNLCSLCGKGFHRAYNLRIHMRTHTGERPFQCDHCPKSFAQSNDLKAHIRRHTGERFKCTECDASFFQLYGLRNHALSAHGIQMEPATGRLQKFPIVEEYMRPPRPTFDEPPTTTQNAVAVPLQTSQLTATATVAASVVPAQP